MADPEPLAPGALARVALAGLPAPWPHPMLASIAAVLRSSRQVLVVLDDDPTGTQTVHDVAVLTAWTQPELTAALGATLAGNRVLFLLTNSRSLAEVDAVAMAFRVGAEIEHATRDAAVEAVVVSRSDSTLRGHFPAEVDALARGLGRVGDPVVVFPAFTEGGRITIGGVHYALVADAYVPVGATEFARDASFGFVSSALADWVQEKTGGRTRAADVVVVDLPLLRSGGPAAVAERVAAVDRGGVIVVDAVEDRDVEVAVAGLVVAEGRGARFLYRTAASFVRVRAGQERRPWLTGTDLCVGALESGGGLVVVGSHTARTTEQLNAVLGLRRVSGVEVSVDTVLRGDGAEVERATSAAAGAMDGGDDVVLFTSRTVRTGADAESSLSLSRVVSDAMCAVVAGLGRPRFLVAKGGITASDVATKALGVRRATVLGQALAGVPVWELGEESRHPGLRYVVFPGNVGDADALVQLVQRCRGDEN